MAIINTNISAVITQNAMMKNDRDMQTTMERLSTGKSVNSAQDDAAGIAVSSRMTSQIKGLDQAVQNAGDAISMIQTADGASIELGNMMQRMRELAVQATNGTVTSTDQGSLDLEFQQLKAEISRVANNSQWNGNNILDGTAGTSSNGTATFQIGANAQQVMDVEFGNWNLNAPTSNINAVYNVSMSDATAADIDRVISLSDGTSTVRIDYATTVATVPTDLADLVSDIQRDSMYSALDFTVAVDSAGTGIDFTYKTAGAVSAVPVFSATVDTSIAAVYDFASITDAALTAAKQAGTDITLDIDGTSSTIDVATLGTDAVKASTSFAFTDAQVALLADSGDGFTVVAPNGTSYSMSDMEAFTAVSQVVDQWNDNHAASSGLTASEALDASGATEGFVLTQTDAVTSDNLMVMPDAVFTFVEDTTTDAAEGALAGEQTATSVNSSVATLTVADVVADSTFSSAINGFNLTDESGVLRATQVSGASFTGTMTSSLGDATEITAGFTDDVEVASNMTVTTGGVSVAAVAAIYQTSLSEAEIATIDGNVVLSDGKHSLTVDASGVSTINELTSLITSHPDHADLGFTVTQTAAVTGVPAAFTISALADADIATLATATSPISISDGTTTIAVTTTNPDQLNGNDTLANLVTLIQADSNYADLAFTVTANSTTGLLLTSKTDGPATIAPSVSGNATHTVVNTVTGTTAVASGLTFTYEDAKAVLSTPTIKADGGGFDIANGVTEVTAGFTALTSVFGRDLSDLSIATDVGANTALADLDAALDGINAQRAVFGAGMNRLEYAIDNLSNGSMNAAASRSRIEDADYATETTELARTQIIQQASTAMLAQANQSNQSVLSLLKG